MNEQQEQGERGKPWKGRTGRRRSGGGRRESNATANTGSHSCPRIDTRVSIDSSRQERPVVDTRVHGDEEEEAEAAGHANVPGAGVRSRGRSSSTDRGER